MTGDRRADAFRAIPIFRDLSDESLKRVLDLATEVDLHAGHVLIEAHREGSGLFVIEDGTVVVETGGRRIELGPGDFVGELALLTDSHRSARVQAQTNVRVLAISRTDFEKLIDEEPRLALAMLRTLAARLAAADSH